MAFFNEDSTFNSRAQDSMQAKPADGPMRVALMASEGALQTIWLPAYKEGRYCFSGESELEKSIYIEAKNGVWCVFSKLDVNFSQGGRYLGRSAMLEDCGLLIVEHDGQRYVLYSEIERKNGNVFRAYYIEQQGEFLIGRSDQCDICCFNRLISRVHAALYWSGNCWHIQDRNSKSGVYLNNRIVTDAPLCIGDVIYIVGLRIAIGAGFIAINDADGKSTVNTPRLRMITTDRDAYFSGAPVIHEGSDSFKRKPRKRNRTEREPIEFELPPMNPTGNNIPFLLRMGSPAISGGRALASGNIAMALTSMVLPFITGGMTEKDRKEYAQKRESYYTAYLHSKRQEIEQARLDEAKELNHDFPTLHQSVQFVKSRDRMWERGKTDDDFLKLRLRFGKLPLATERNFPKQHFDIEPDPLETAMFDLAKKEVLLENVPITVSFMEDHVCGISGGKNRLQLVASLIAQLCVSHSYEDVKVILLANPSDLEQLSFTRMLPHFWDDDRSTRLIATNKSEALTIGEFLKKQFDEERPSNKVSERLKTKPMFLLIALDKSLFETLEAMRDFMNADNNRGMSIVAAYEGLPVECHRLIELDDDGNGASYNLRCPEKPHQRFRLDSYHEDEVRQAMKMISGIKSTAQDEVFVLPKMVTFLEMFNAGKVEHLNPMNRWSENNPVKSLAAPVGVGTDGELFYLDLHEKKQGPHGLVAGMTGSGKSEFIITYILSMAVNYSPDEVAFILIDYKGGGLAGAFDDPRRGVHLPHLVGTITNLDGAAVQRSLTSIQSELKRRQAVFNRAKSELDEGTMDIYSYQKHFRNGKVSEPMPHLFIISDEFAELKSQRPEFMDGLISIARIGRSLGVHLILATQKPSGVVNDQIMSNTKFRVCLKVQSKADSMDMIKRQDAAELKDTGRFYLQVGFNEYFAMGQSAWCGADYQPTDHVVAEVDNAVQFVDSVGQTVLKVKPKVEKKKSDIKQIVAIVRYLSDLAQRENIQPKQLWLDPLPNAIDYNAVARGPVPSRISALVGMADDPENQKQFPCELDLQHAKNVLIAGQGSSGRSTFLQTMLYSLSTRYTPETLHYYLIDFSGGSLSAFASLPHCGGVYTESDELEIKKLLAMIKQIMTERKKLFAQADVSNYDAYCQISPLPLIVVAIDNYTGFTAFKDGSTLTMNFHEYLRESHACGIKFVITCSNVSELSLRAKQELVTRYTLTLKDQYAYSDALNLRCTFTPPDKAGRGIFVQDGRALEYHTLMFAADSKASERIALLKKDLAARANYGAGSAAKRLATIDPTETYEHFCADIPGGRIPLGYSVNDVKKVSMPFAQLFTMSLYFGNSAGVQPVMDNLLYAVRRDRMDCVIVKRSNGSLFDGKPVSMDIRYLNSTKEDSIALWRLLAQEIEQRKRFRNDYCARYNLPPQSPESMKKAAPYIRQNTRPLMIIFESIADFCREADESCGKIFPTILAGGFGYNFYFTCCTYHDDSDRVSMDPLFKHFIKGDFFLFMGGRFQNQHLDMMPGEYRKVTEPSKDYTAGLLKYGGSYHPIKMPCGDLQAAAVDPDELPII